MNFIETPEKQTNLKSDEFSHTSSSGFLRGLDLASVTQDVFWIATVAMGCGTVFWLERNSVTPDNRSALVVAGLVTGMACFHYFQMASVYAGGEFPKTTSASRAGNECSRVFGAIW